MRSQRNRLEIQLSSSVSNLEVLGGPQVGLSPQKRSLGTASLSTAQPPILGLSLPSSALPSSLTCHQASPPRQVVILVLFCFCFCVCKNKMNTTTKTGARLLNMFVSRVQTGEDGRGTQPPEEIGTGLLALHRSSSALDPNHWHWCLPGPPAAAHGREPPTSSDCYIMRSSFVFDLVASMRKIQHGFWRVKGEEVLEGEAQTDFFRM